MNAIEKPVVSGTVTPDDITWTSSRLIPADGALDAIAALRARDGGDLAVVGSATVARALLEAGLVDELNLMIEPVILGGGRRTISDDGVGRAFDSQVASAGVPVCTYQPTGQPLGTGSSDELDEDPAG